MPILSSEINAAAAEFRDRLSRYEQLRLRHRELLAKASFPESEEAVALARKRGKLLSSERIEALLDPGAPFLPIAPLAGAGVAEYGGPGAGIHCGIGSVEGQLCMVVANNPAVKGGSYFPLTVKKHLRAQEIALENRLPCIYLVDSGGAYLPMQDEVFPDRFHFGRIFANQAMMSAAGIPQLAVVLGSCTAGGAYVPAMSDETIMVRGNATIFLGGPPLVKAATGEVVTAEELGGAEVHCKISGVADHLAENDEHALLLARSAVAHLGATPKSPCIRLARNQTPEPPRYSPEEIPGILGDDLKKSFSMREVLARLLDGSRFHEFKREFGTTLLCGFGHIDGFELGIVANDGVLFSESALKAAHFIELCNQRLIPLLFLQNITGFMVGKAYEHEGIAKHGAKMVSAVATCRVPRLTVMVGGSFGAGNYAMCGRAYDPRFLFSWPNSRISVMGGLQAARVLTDIRRAANERRNEPVDEPAMSRYHDEIYQTYERQGDPYYATARLWDDGVIDPVTTRQTLALALAAISYDPTRPYTPGVFRM